MTRLREGPECSALTWMSPPRKRRKFIVISLTISILLYTSMVFTIYIYSIYISLSTMVGVLTWTVTGTRRPVQNPYSWNNSSIINQPVGVVSLKKYPLIRTTRRNLKIYSTWISRSFPALAQLEVAPPEDSESRLSHWQDNILVYLVLVVTFTFLSLNVCTWTFELVYILLRLHVGDSSLSDASGPGGRAASPLPPSQASDLARPSASSWCPNVRVPSVQKHASLLEML